MVSGSTTTYTATTLTGLSAGTKTLAESDVAGYSEGIWSCDGAGTVVSTFDGGSVVLLNGEDVTCTISNDDDAASLTVVKAIVNDDGGAAVVSAFGITTDAGALAFGTGVVSGSTTTYTATTLTGLSAGTKTLAESDVAGYSEGIWSCDGAGTVVSTFDGGSVVLLNGEDVTCTISNDDDAASLTVVKAIVNDDGGAAVVSAFGITTDAGALAFGTGVVSGSTTTYTATTLTGLSAGTKTLAESDVAGYSEGIWSCDGAGTVVSTFDGGSVVLLNGEDVTCTISNDDDAASLTVVKAIVNDDGGAAVVSAFGITTDAGALAFGTGVVSGSTTTYTATTLTGLSAGTKTLAESDVAGYSEGIWSCDGAGTVVSTFDGGSVVLLNGEDVTCTITNDDIPGTLIIQKVAVGIGLQTAEFDFEITPPVGAQFTETISVSGGGVQGQAAFTLSGLALGAPPHTVTELALPVNWVFTSLNCSLTGSGAGTSTFSTSGQTATVTLVGAGDTVTCVYTNTHVATRATQGFWSTHLGWTLNGNGLENAITVAATDLDLCGGLKVVGTVPELMGGFWSRISWTAEPPRRTRRIKLNQARMQLIQQWLAAVLNHHVFGAVDVDNTIAAGEAAYCGNSRAAIIMAADALAEFNESGGFAPFPDGFEQGSADPKTARSIADRPFWNMLP